MMRERQLLPIRVSATDGVVMYETNFGFHRQPFQCVDLTRAFFVSESIRSVLPQLLHALRSDLGIAVLTGPAGVGKTSLLKHLQSLLANDGRVVLCSGAGLVTPSEVLNTLQAASSPRSADASAEVHGSVTAQNRWTVVEQMRKTTEFWGPVLLLVDDAQLLSVPVLNELRAFTEEEWHGRALVRCLIAGPLNLEEELARPAHVDFSRRVRCHAFLKPLSSKESLECLNRHLTVVGGKLKDVFTPEALNLIAIACDGLPRCLTLLADEALVIAAERSMIQADEDCVRAALNRLQHLAYAWNVSPRNSDHQSMQIDPDAETPAWTSIVATSDETQTIGNSSGVFEIGARPSSAFMDTVQSTATQSEASLNLIESTSSIEGRSLSFSEPEAHPLMSVPERVNSTSFEFGSPPTQSFEVGHRYLPDALEASDVVEMDEFATTPISPEDALIKVDPNEPSENSTTARLPPAAFASADASEQHSRFVHDIIEEELPSFGGVLSSREGTPAPAPASSQAVHFLSHDEDSEEGFATSTITIDSQEQVFRSALGSDLSNRLPVFDRYTWIALGRDVPSGTYAVSSASDMRRVTENESGIHETWLSSTSPNVTTSVDKVVVSRSTDSEIMAMLKAHQTNPDEGDFVTFRPGPAYGQVVQISPDPLAPPIGFSSVAAPQIVASEVEQSTKTTSSPAEDEVISDENRQVIQNAIRSGLLASLADAATSVPPVDRFDVVDSFSTLNDPATIGYTGVTDQFQINGWHDGQLIFNADSSQQTLDQLATHNAAMAPEPEQVSLNFEAARLARNGQTSVARDYANATHQEPERTEPKFFSLPNGVRSLEWDLRGSILSTDDTGPLADSLASLRDEVSRFQKTGRITSAAELKSSELDINFRNEDSGTGSDTLVSAARNRIESFAAAETRVSSAMGTVADASILTQTALPASNVDHGSVLAEAAVLPEPASSAADNRSPSGAAEPAEFGPRYSQLFTKLRQVRSRVAGNR